MTRRLGGALMLLLAIPAVLTAIEVVAFAVGSPGVVGAVEGLFGPICHHDPPRTFTLGGRLLPVCARCTGMYLGLTLGGGTGLALGATALRSAAVAGVLLGTLGLGAAILEAAGILSTGNVVRAALGFAMGAGPVLIVGLGARVLLDEPTP